MFFFVMIRPPPRSSLTYTLLPDTTRVLALVQNPMLRELVEDKLSVRWSPEQIAGWLRRQFPGDESKQISHEAIYLALFDPRRRAIERTLTRRLRTEIGRAHV